MKTIIADFTTSLSGKISVGDTTGAIQNNLDDDGVALPTGEYYFALDSDSTVKEHISATLTGKNLTDIKSISRQGVKTTGVAREHRIGASVKITDFAYIKDINDFADQYDGKWEGAVANFAALPQPAEDGEVRVTLDDSKIYVYDLETTTWNLAGAGGGAGTVYITTKLGTEAEGDDNKTFQLNSGSFPDKKYLQVYKNGVLMGEGATNDYIATGSNQAVFNAVVLDDDVITLLVVSVDIYNPAWNLVDGDILPDVDATHDIGSSIKQFVSGFFSGIVKALGFVGTSVTSQSNFIKLTAGENITVTAGLPMAVYIKPSDGKIYQSLASATASALFDGFILVSCSTNDTVDVQIGGIISGFTGLTTGTNYFISNTAGLLTATATNSTYPQMVGKVLSATQVFIDKTSTVFNEKLDFAGGTAASKSITPTKPWKYAYVYVTGHRGSGSVLGLSNSYIDRVGVTTAVGTHSSDGNVSVAISGNNIVASYGNGDTGGVAGGSVYLYAN